MPPVDYYFGGMLHWRRQHHQRCWKRKGKPPAPQVACFFGRGVEGGQPATPQVDCFWGDAASKEETSPTLLEMRSQTTSTAGCLFFFDVAFKRPAMPKVDFLEGCCSQTSNTTD